MPRYYFDVTDDGADRRDGVGRDLPGPKAAQARAVRLAATALREPDRAAAEGTAAVDARDEDGRHVCTARLVVSDRTD